MIHWIMAVKCQSVISDRYQTCGEIHYWSNYAKNDQFNKNPRLGTSYIVCVLLYDC